MFLNKHLCIKILIKHIGTVVLLCFFLGCGGKHHGTEVYKIYSEPDKDTIGVASIILSTTDKNGYITDYIDWIEINGTRVDHKKYGKIRVLPGSYTVEWHRSFAVSVMLKSSGIEKRSWGTNITLEAGHTYTVHAKRTIGHGYKIYSWITDDTLGKVIWGKKFIPGPYYYLRDS